MDFFAHDTAVLDEGCQVGKDTKIWHFAHVFPRAVIGESCVLGQNVMVANEVTLGNNVRVQNNVSLYTGVTCEDDVFIGPSAVFTNVLNPRSHVSRKDEFKGTKVEKGASIGANATIVCGITIGQYAFIGAGSVVTKDVAPYQLVVGNPARPMGWMSRFGFLLNFNSEGRATCEGSGDVYLEENGQVKVVSYGQD
jgi:UDP-2-acetamido-3-amino-2,3-dideoxy-glucuronate N-acetyltransferase